MKLFPKKTEPRFLLAQENSAGLVLGGSVNGLYVCSYPGAGGGGGAARTDLHVRTFQENLP